MRWLLWWFSIFAAYVITALTRNGSEIVAGAIIAALATLVVARAFASGDPDARAHWSWLRYLAKVPVRMIADALLVWARIVRTIFTGDHLEGYYVRLRYDPGDRSDPWTMGREALVIMGVNAAPNSMVADVDLRGELVLHKLVAQEQPHGTPEWPL
jgi:hypothetical protein